MTTKLLKTNIIHRNHSWWRIEVTMLFPSPSPPQPWVLVKYSQPLPVPFHHYLLCLVIYSRITCLYANNMARRSNTNSVRPIRSAAQRPRDVHTGFIRANITLSIRSSTREENPLQSAPCPNPSPIPIRDYRNNSSGCRLVRILTQLVIPVLEDRLYVFSRSITRHVHDLQKT